jgi:hypothetical protein
VAYGPIARQRPRNNNETTAVARQWLERYFLHRSRRWLRTQQWIKIGRGNRSTRRKPAPASLCAQCNFRLYIQLKIFHKVLILLKWICSHLHTSVSLRVIRRKCFVINQPSSANLCCHCVQVCVLQCSSGPARTRPLKTQELISCTTKPKPELVIPLHILSRRQDG